MLSGVEGQGVDLLCCLKCMKIKGLDWETDLTSALLFCSKEVRLMDGL